MEDNVKEARGYFEKITAMYYEDDFVKYDADGDYVSAQQQDDFMMFLSGFNCGRSTRDSAHDNK